MACQHKIYRNDTTISKIKKKRRSEKIHTVKKRSNTYLVFEIIIFNMLMLNNYVIS
jgi:hypothetical protein